MKADKRQRIEAVLEAWGDVRSVTVQVDREVVCPLCWEPKAHEVGCEYANLERAIMNLPFAQKHQRTSG